MTVDKENWKVQFETQKGYLDTYINAISAFREEGQVIATEDTIFSDVVDPSNVGMCKSKISGKGLNTYESRFEGQHVIGVSFEQWSDRLSGISSNSNVVITYPVVKQGANLMNIDVVDEDLEINLPLIDKDSVPQAPQKDPISSDTKIKVTGSKLSDVIKHCKKVESDQNKAVHFRIADSTLEIYSEDPVKGSVSKKFHSSGPQDMESVDVEKETMISIDYLDDLQSVIPSKQDITMHIDDSYPIRLDFNIDDKGDAKVIYVIAPRLEQD